MIPATVRVFVCTEPQDMRRGFDRLAQVVQQVMGGDPRSDRADDRAGHGLGSQHILRSGQERGDILVSLDAHPPTVGAAAMPGDRFSDRQARVGPRRP